jgi:lauroyl/myristoyl acyltransferase
MTFLPTDWTMAIGAFMGERAALQAIREKKDWVKNLHNNFEKLQGITDPVEREQKIIQWTKRVGSVHAGYPILQRMVTEGRLEVLGKENLENTTRPVIFTSCHLSNWEMIGYVFAPLPIPFCTLYAPPENPVYLNLAIQARKAWRNTNSEFIPASPRAMFALTRALAQGKNLVLFIDEERDGYIWGPSLGRKLPYAGNRWLAARLAVRYQVDIIPLYVEQIANARYRVVIEPKLEHGSGDAEDQARFFADQIDQRCDRWVRTHLNQWYWLSALDLDKPLPR